MNCEICGKKIVGRPTQISVERSLLAVCQECVRFGSPVDRRTAARIEKTTPKPGSRRVVPPPQQKRMVREDFGEFVLIDNFGEVIRKAREALKLSREEFASKLGEKESVMRRIESGEMYPTAMLTKRIEQLLKISLKANIDSSIKGSAPAPSNLTLGDIAVLKEGRSD